MAYDWSQSAWHFYRRYNFLFSLLLLVIGTLVIIVAVYLIPNQQASSVTLGVGTSFIASVIFASLTRYFIEKEFEGLFGDTIAKAITQATETIVYKIDFKIDHLKQFMPIEPFVGRDQASDIVERKAQDLFSKCRRYRSYGITGKYAVYRLHKATSEYAATTSSLSKEIVLYVAHPDYIKTPIIFAPQAKRKELIGAMALIDEILRETNEKARLSIEVRFVLPLPILRFDIFEGSEDHALIYMYEDIGPDQTQLPDAGLYDKNSHWYQMTRDALVCYDSQTLFRWHSSQRPELSRAPGDSLTQIPDVSVNVPLTELMMEYFGIEAQEFDVAKAHFKKEFMKAMDMSSFKGP